jgi:hypothetical protein
MPRIVWPLHQSRPLAKIVLFRAADQEPFSRSLLADTGAGTGNSDFELILENNDCLLAGGNKDPDIRLHGAYKGVFPLYLLRVLIPALGFDEVVPVVAAPVDLTGFDGIARFRFLNRFGYGNFGNPNQFGLETP